MTTADLETLRGLLKLAEDTTQAPWSAMWSGRTDGDHVTGLGCEIHGPLMETGVFKPASHIIAKVQDHMSHRIWRGNAAFISASRNAIPALTALLANYGRMREGLDSAIQQLAELAQPLTPALNGSYAKGEQIGYENAVRILSALRATLKGEKHE